MGIRKDAVKKGKRKADAPEWEEVGSEFTRRTAIVEVYGDTDTGRTSFGLTAPGPIGLIHASEKLDGIAEPFVADGKVIKVVNFGKGIGGARGDKAEIKKRAALCIRKLYGAWYDAIDSWAKSVILDTHSEAWEILRLARFGELTPRGNVASMYGPVNAEWRALMTYGRDQSKSNVIIIGQTKDEYKRDKATGKRVRAGQKQVGYHSDVVLRTSRTKDGDFVATVEKPWMNSHMRDFEFVNEEINFPYIMSLITETDEEEWQ